MVNSSQGLLGSTSRKGERIVRHAKAKGTKVAKRLRREVKGRGKEFKQNMSSDSVYSAAFRTLCLIGFYYVTSIGLTFFQSSLIKKIKFPMTIVSVHFLIKLILSYFARISYEIYTGKERVTLEWKTLLGRVGVVAVVAALDIGLSQAGFQYIQVALYTVTKSTSIIFILLFSLIFGLERKHWSLIAIVSMIGVGLMMFTYKSTDFNLLGFSMVLTASFLSGIRWTLSQLIMQRSSLGLSNPIDMIYHVQPIMTFTLLPFVLGFDGPKLLDLAEHFSDYNFEVFALDVGEVMAGGILAFLMEASEFLLVSHTSSLTLSISGIVKEIITMGLAVIYQSTDLSNINLAGLVVCLLGISAHVLKKSMETGARSPGGSGYRSVRTQGDPHHMPLLSSSDLDSEEELYCTKMNSKPLPEDLVLRDSRQWTSVKDKHVESLMHAQDTPISYRTQDSIQIEAGLDDNDALEEADQLLQQLDLMSSD